MEEEPMSPIYPSMKVQMSEQRMMEVLDDYRLEKDKKEQKSSFRDIIRYIDDNDEFYEKISFGHGESLEIDNWAQKKQFDALRKVRRFFLDL